MEPLRCCLAAVFLHECPGHCFGRSAAKIVADCFFGVLTHLRLYIWPKGGTKKNLACPSAPIEAAWQGEASGLLLSFSRANRGVKFENV